MIIYETEYLQKLHESLGEAIFAVQLPERIIEYVNPAIEKVLGYSPFECIGRNTEIIYPTKQDYVNFGELLNECIRQKKETFKIECNLKRKNGEIFPAEITVSFIKKNDNILSNVAIVNDITERRQSELALKESEKKFRSLFVSIGQGAAICEVVTDKSGSPIDYVFLDINDRYTEITGLKRKMVLGRKASEIDPEIEKYWIETLGKVALTGEPDYIEGKWEKANKYYAINAYSHIKGQFVALVSDITERKEFEKEFADSEKKFRTLFENMAQGVFYQNADGSLIDVNQAALEMFGLTRNQFIGRDSYDPNWKVVDKNGAELQPEKHPSMVALRTGKPVRNYELAVFNPNTDKYTWLIVNAFPQFRNDIDQNPSHVFVTMHDISLRKNTEAMLNDYKDKLEERVAERTEELQTMVNAFARRENRINDLKKVIKKLHRQLKDAGITPVADDPLKNSL